MIRMNNALRDARWNNIFNSGAGVSAFDNGVLEIRTGAQPADADTAASGTVLVTINLPADAMGVSSSGVIAKSGTWQDLTADASGEAGWFRIRNAGDTLRLDGTITSTAVGTGDMLLDNTNIAAGQQVTVSTFSLTDPA